ncbi:DUF1707 SHOCT-like domain-containing protein [Pseudonocardia alaniniphila]|uniref:DUF1707 domain-containing protein n=1 Tax=Pseudonocardia alaniniphila TaxID=75291 RepID=A0ABS9TF93_9PSEU|nr:DUF1707 domain-containing protein [Pseudonocardia alaniniphila]MCH6167214.1 DUF1707 domain-containing protein [Pseudonocardia alaniniphila]
MDETADPGPPHVRPEDMRAGDVDREQVLDRLRIAHAEGRLDLDEFDERITSTLAARTYADLRALTVDLPGQPPSPPAATTPPEPGPLQDLDALQERDLRGAVIGWAGASVTTIAIWAMSCIATASFVYPWWIWVAGPWGLVLLSSWVRDRRQ